VKSAGDAVKDHEYKEGIIAKTETKTKQKIREYILFLSVNSRVVVVMVVLAL
jgi:hypothetical protein